MVKIARQNRSARALDQRVLSRNLDMADVPLPCPACGTTATRLLTRKELRDRNDGRDPLVVTRPRICTACSHVWEPPPSKGLCYVVAALAGIGWLVGMALLVGAVWLLIAAISGRGGDANSLANRLKVAAVGLVGIALASGSFAMIRKYLRLARASRGGPG
jgi:hypothetical protein